MIWRDMPVGGIFLRLGLRDASLCLGQAGVGGFPGASWSRIPTWRSGHLCRDPGRVPIQLGALGVRLGAVQVRLGGLDGGIGSDGIGLRASSEARVAFTSAADCTFSSWASNCPFFTRSPSFT